MVERAAQDYAKIFQSVNPDREINPICTNVEDMLARLDEFETLLTSVKAETNGIMENHVNSILQFHDNFQTLLMRIDNLDKFVDTVNENVTAVEKSLDIAEQELNISDYSLKGLLLKPLFSKSKTNNTNDNNVKLGISSNLKDDEFQPIPIFKTSAYFGCNDNDYDNST